MIYSLSRRGVDHKDSSTSFFIICDLLRTKVPLHHRKQNVEKPPKLKFGSEIFILSFYKILAEKHVKFHNFLTKSLDSVEIHSRDK